MKRYLLNVSLLLVFTLCFFGLRYFAHLQHYAMEDELLAIGNNMMYSIEELWWAPDFTHPPLWYILMDLPTHFLGLEYGIFYYRLINVSLLFLLISLSVYFFRDLGRKLLFIYFSLFSSNLYLVYVTFQHRMYALVIGIAILYSLYWFKLINGQHDRLSNKHFFALGVVAGLGFLVNYSMLWIIPIWPLVFLFNKTTNKLKWRQIFWFCFAAMLSVCWFIPTFISNIYESVDKNQWSPEFNLLNLSHMFGNYFGFVPLREHMGSVNSFFVLFAALLGLLTFMVFVNKKWIKYLPALFALSTSLIAYLLTVKITGNSLLYARTSITFVVVFYLLIAFHIASLWRSYVIRIIFFTMVILQATQFVIYFFPTQQNGDDYNFFANYKHNPISHFSSYRFIEGSCLVTIPNWNTTAANYFLSKKVSIIQANMLPIRSVTNSVFSCAHVYILEQESIGEPYLQTEYDKFQIDRQNLQMLVNFKNQNLYILPAGI